MRRQLIIQLWIISRETYFYPQLCLSIIINIFPSTITSTYSYSYNFIYIYYIYLNYLKMISRCSPHLEHTINNPSELPQPCGWNRWTHGGTSKVPTEGSAAAWRGAGHGPLRTAGKTSGGQPGVNSCFSDGLVFFYGKNRCMMRFHGFSMEKNRWDEISWIFHGRTWEFHWTSLEFSWNR